jgi:hypothetical protein
MHKPNSIFSAANEILLGEAKDDKKFEITPKIQEILADLADQVSFRIDAEQQIDALMKEVDKISKKYQSLEVKYWKEVDKQGVNPRLIAAPALAALNKVANSKK